MGKIKDDKKSNKKMKMNRKKLKIIIKKEIEDQDSDT
jgi:hypothetical protein